MLIGRRVENYRGYKIISVQRTNYYLFMVDFGGELICDTFCYDPDILLIRSHADCIRSAKYFIDSRV